MLRAPGRLRPVLALAASFFLGLTAAPSSRGDALPARAVHVADYDMRVRLDPEAKTLDGRQRIVWRNPAPEPVGGEIALDVAFEAKLPRVFARTGHLRDYFLVGQWFPKVGAYEPAGARGRATGGWNCH